MNILLVTLATLVITWLASLLIIGKPHSVFWIMLPLAVLFAAWCDPHSMVASSNPVVAGAVVGLLAVYLLWLSKGSATLTNTVLLGLIAAIAFGFLVDNAILRAAILVCILAAGVGIAFAMA